MRLLSRSRLLPVWVLLIGAHAWGAGPLFNILDYGARNDGAASSTEAIRSAIQAAKAAGGGTVYIPAGKYISGPIELVGRARGLLGAAGDQEEFRAYQMDDQGREQRDENISFSHTPL